MSDEYVDILIVGAGLSGIGAGVQLKQRCPDRTFTILESREKSGGTWDLFRYPGIRSDSDMHTMGYRFKPWKAKKAIADGAAILEYIRETASEYQIENHIRYQHRVKRANWSTEDRKWHVEIQRLDTDQIVQLRCNILYMCAGYYSYQKGYSPDFPHQQRFKGPVIHPQNWPEGLDYTNKRVVIIGSGATAITLVPAMAQTAAHVTMLQRSPTYILAWPDTDIIANTLNKVLPAKIAYWIIRQKNIWMQQYFYQFSQRYPERTKANLLKRIATQLPPHIDVEKHFDPSYSPWEQRLCVSPNGDIFKALNNRSASVVTDHIQEFTEDGIALRSGDLLEADIIITATGLNLVIFGDVNFSIDEKAVDFSQTWSYKGVASSDIPNLFSCFGYINASWTLRADLTSEFLCRVINHMTETKTTQCTPRLRSSDQFMLEKPWIEGFNPGYIQRFSGNFPKQGDRDPWLNTQDYQRDKELLQRAPVEDDVLQFS